MWLYQLFGLYIAFSHSSTVEEQTLSYDDSITT